MAVDRGYGSGKPLSAAQSASRRAAAGRAASRKRTVAAAGKKYGQKKGMSYTNPGMRASQNKRMTLDNRRMSEGLLEGFTGFNKRDGVDLGDIAGLAISIPTAGVGGLLRAGARAVLPKAARIALASRRVARRSASTANAAAEQSKRLFAEGKQLQEKSNNLYYPVEVQVRPGVRRVLEPTENNIRDSRFFGSQANDKVRMGRSAAQIAQRARSTSTPSSASAEIKRRLNEMSRLEEEYMKGIKGRKPKPGELEW